MFWGNRTSPFHKKNSKDLCTAYSSCFGWNWSILRTYWYPLPATGAGIAMAFRAGALISDMRYIQFHPTSLKGNDNPFFLISEAV